MYDLLIYNGIVFDGVHFSDKTAVLIHEGKIQRVLSQREEKDYMLKVLQKIDAQNNIIMPGMIDLQLNGCGGVLFNDAQTIEVLQVMNQTNVQYGCTTFLPTLITSADEKIIRALECVEAAVGVVPGVAGIHLEGPMISTVKKGIHQERFIHTFDVEMMNRLIEYKDIVKMLTLAPECVEYEVLETLSEHVPLSIGHSNATYEVCQEKGKYFTHATHLWNAMSPLESRNPGVVGYVLNSHLYTGVIADCLHVDPANIHIAATCLSDTLYVTTDAVTPAGRSDIESFEFEGNVVYVKDGMCCNAEGQLGGANITMVESVRNLVERVHLDVAVALRMATSIPAQAIKEEQIGGIHPGMVADVVILNTEEWVVQQTLQKGESVYEFC